MEYKTIAMETYAKRSYNYQNEMVDSSGLPYFNIFWTEPAEAAHDWPDFGDVMSRQLQGAIMAKHMTGEAVKIADTWFEKISSYLDPESGLLVRPETNYSKKEADPGDNALTLYALMTVYLDNPQQELKAKIQKIVDTLLEKTIEEGAAGNGSFLGGFGIKSLMICARYLNYEPALKLAGILVNLIFVDAPLFTPDNHFRHGGHMHGNLRCLVGAADYALAVKDAVLYSRINALYQYVRSEATRFGFLPEAIGRKGDIVSCETCAIMDYLGLAVTLANHGHPEYWGDVERIARNHLIESQLVDGSWLIGDESLEDSEQFSRRDIGKRMVGGYAGWSSPNHFLGARETLNAHWGGPELKNKTRVFQNCCGGSGTHAFFEVWKNAARFQDNCLYVNLHIDKLLPQALIRGYQPYKGLTTIEILQECQKVKIRIPEFVQPDQIIIKINQTENTFKVWGNYITVSPVHPGDKIEMSYPLPIFVENIKIGNPGFREYHYKVTWKGDTVIQMKPIDNEFQTGYSDFDKRDVPVFFGEEGPAPLYQRESLLSDITPSLADLHMDDGSLDFWVIP